MDVRPLRRTRAPTPGSQHPPSTASHNPPGFPRLPSSAAAHRRQARSSSPLRGCGGSSLTPDRPAARKLAAARKAQHNSQPRRLPGHRVRTARPLDSESPHGWPICGLAIANRRHMKCRPESAARTLRPPGSPSPSRSVIAVPELASSRRQPLADSVFHAYRLNAFVALSIGIVASWSVVGTRVSPRTGGRQGRA